MSFGRVPFNDSSCQEQKKFVEAFCAAFALREVEVCHCLSLSQEYFEKWRDSWSFNVGIVNILFVMSQLLRVTLPKANVEPRDPHLDNFHLGTPFQVSSVR